MVFNGGAPNLAVLTAKPNTQNGHKDHQGALISAIQSQLRSKHAKRNTMTIARINDGRTDLVDMLYAQNGDPIFPGDVFDRLRWGGTFIYVNKKKSQTYNALKQYREHKGFQIERSIAPIRIQNTRWPIPFFTRNHHFFVARKTHLVQPGRDTNRFTFDVQLAQRPNLSDDYVVMKQVPTHESVLQRLVDRCPETDTKILSRRAAKLVDRVFPVFLTRETGFLEILHRKLPDAYKTRIPKVLAVRRDSDRLVRKVYLNWLRPGPDSISQLEFAKQSADLLRILHDTAGIIHLDLRLDNYVISEHGVGFVDFGSAVRIGENIDRSPMLLSLFDEMMSTSQIQNTLGKMKKSGRVTSKVIGDAHQKLDKAADLFYLTLQMTKPHANPDFKGLVDCDKQSDHYRLLSHLAKSVLRPRDPANPRISTAAQLLQRIHRIEQQLDNPYTGRPDRPESPLESPLPTPDHRVNAGSNF